VNALIHRICDGITLGVEAVAALLIAYGTLEALVLLAPDFVGYGRVDRRRDVWRRFAVWLQLSLQFELAADIVRSAIAPTWTDIGQLAAIAVIRTFLSYFLEADIARLRPSRKDGAAPSNIPLA